MTSGYSWSLADTSAHQTSCKSFSTKFALCLSLLEGLLLKLLFQEDKFKFLIVLRVPQRLLNLKEILLVLFLLYLLVALVLSLQFLKVIQLF